MATEEWTNCVICTEFFVDPQVLPCKHVFCKSCVNRWKDAWTIECPFCRKLWVTDDVKPDVRLAESLAKLTPTTITTDDNTVGTPQVRSERGENWSLEGAVDIQTLPGRNLIHEPVI